MKPLLVFALCLFYIVPSFAAKDAQEVDVETSKRTRYAVELLRKTCLMHFTDRPALVKLLNTRYVRPPENEVKNTLDFLHAESGDVWLVVMSPVVVYTIASETNGNCHIITELIDSALLHKHLKYLAADVRDSRSFNVVDYKGVSEIESPVKTSEFVVKAPDGGVIVTARAMTKDHKKSKLAEGVLSTFRPPQ